MPDRDRYRQRVPRQGPAARVRHGTGAGPGRGRVQSARLPRHLRRGAGASWRRAACTSVQDKHALFLAALDHYRARRRHGASHRRRHRARTTAQVAGLLRRIVARPAGPAGAAWWWSSAAELSFFDEDVAERVTTALGRNEALLAGLIREGQEDGSLAVHIDPADAARMLLCLVQGMRVVGKDGPPAAGHAGGGGRPWRSRRWNDRPPGGSRRLLPI